jgi:hypothetical protein
VLISASQRGAGFALVVQTQSLRNCAQLRETLNALIEGTTPSFALRVSRATLCASKDSFS